MVQEDLGLGNELPRRHALQDIGIRGQGRDKLATRRKRAQRFIIVVGVETLPFLCFIVLPRLRVMKPSSLNRGCPSSIRILISQAAPIWSLRNRRSCNKHVSNRHRAGHSPLMHQAQAYLHISRRISLPWFSPLFSGPLA